MMTQTTADPPRSIWQWHEHPQLVAWVSTPIGKLVLWLVATGQHVISTGQASEVDRADRRDLSIFRIGWDFIERRLALNDPILPIFLPVFAKVSGG